MCLMGMIACVVHICGGQKSISGVLLSHSETGSLAGSEHRLKEVGQSVSLRSHQCWDYRCGPPLCLPFLWVPGLQTQVLCLLSVPSTVRLDLSPASEVDKLY